MENKDVEDFYHDLKKKLEEVPEPQRLKVLLMKALDASTMLLGEDKKTISDIAAYAVATNAPYVTAIAIAAFAHRKSYVSDDTFKKFVTAITDVQVGTYHAVMATDTKELYEHDEE